MNKNKSFAILKKYLLLITISMVVIYPVYADSTELIEPLLGEVLEEAPIEEAPIEEAPIEEAPIEEAPIEEAPIEEAPLEEAPLEEVPVVEEPAVEELMQIETVVENVETTTPTMSIQIELPAEEVPVVDAPAIDESVVEEVVEGEACFNSTDIVDMDSSFVINGNGSIRYIPMNNDSLADLTLDGTEKSEFSGKLSLSNLEGFEFKLFVIDVEKEELIETLVLTEVGTTEFSIDISDVGEVRLFAPGKSSDCEFEISEIRLN